VEVRREDRRYRDDGNLSDREAQKARQEILDVARRQMEAEQRRQAQQDRQK
jgi:hypothetical protein